LDRSAVGVALRPNNRLKELQNQCLNQCYDFADLALLSRAEVIHLKQSPPNRKIPSAPSAFAVTAVVRPAADAPQICRGSCRTSRGARRGRK
jgi:hypothetical protein